MILILVLSIIFIVVIEIIIDMPTSTPYSPCNDGKNGYSKLITEYNFMIVKSLDSIQTDNATILISVMKKPDSATLSEISSILNKGGRVIILDEYGYVNKWLIEEMDIPIIIKNTVIIDYIYNYNGDPRLIVATNDENNVKYIFHSPHPIEDIGNLKETNYTMLILTSAYSYEDLDNNTYYNSGEEFGPFKVGLGIRKGNGSIYILSDYDFVRNDLIENNSLLLKQILNGTSKRYLYTGLMNLSIIDNFKITIMGASRKNGAVSSLLIYIAVLIISLFVYYGETRNDKHK